MLGIGRASEYALWWNGKPSFTSRSIISSTTLGQFDGYSSVLPFNAWQIPTDSGSPATYTFNNTGVVSAAAQVMATTIRFDVSSNYTWATDTFRPAYQWAKVDSTSSSADSVNLYVTTNTGTTYQGLNLSPWCRTTTGNRFAIFYSPNGYDYIPFTTSFDSLANTWITIVVAQAPTTASFSNWTGGTPASNFYPVRACIVNSQTGVLIETVDININQFQGRPISYASQTWQPWTDNSDPSGTGFMYMNSFFKWNSTFQPTPNFYYASVWGCLGQVIDPTAGTVPNYKYLCGSNLPGTVGGVQAWVNWSSAGNGTSGSYTGLTNLGAGRITQTNNYGFASLTSNLNTPYQSTTIRP